MLKKVRVPPLFLCVGHGCLQHPGFGSHGAYAICHHTSFKPDDYSLKNAVAFAYGDSIALCLHVMHDNAEVARPRGTTRHRDATLRAAGDTDEAQEADVQAAVVIEP